MLNPKDCNAMQKMLMKECQEFSEKIREQFKTPDSPWDARTLSLTDGPGLMLGMDNVLAQQLQVFNEEQQNKTARAHVLDRDHLGKQYLVEKRKENQ